MYVYIERESREREGVVGEGERGGFRSITGVRSITGIRSDTGLTGFRF